MALITLDDLNGTHYLGLQEGERLMMTRDNVYVFPPGVPAAANKLEKVVMTANEAIAFIKANARYLRSMRTGEAQTYDNVTCAKIAYHRLYAVKHGLVSPNFVKENYFVDYTEAISVTQANVDGYPAFEDADILAACPIEMQKTIRTHFTDMVCLVAFVFRARGHHYTPQLDELYTRVWNHCRYKAEDLTISFQHMATTAFHAIFPSILDDFWLRSVESSFCNGALAKRIEGAPAGSAGPYVLKQGLEDLQMVAPGFKGRLVDQVEYLHEVMVQLSAHRFAGSVNARYYGTRKVQVDEVRLAAIASSIKAALDGLTEGQPLANSAALNRIARNAPITGAVLGRAIKAISDRPEVINSLMIEEIKD